MTDVAESAQAGEPASAVPSPPGRTEGAVPEQPPQEWARLPAPTWRMRLRRVLRWPPKPWWGWIVTVVVGGVLVVALGITWVQTFAYGYEPEGTPPGSAAPVTFSLAVLALAVVTAHRLRSRWPRMVLPSAALLAGAALLLGAAAYGPCPSDVPVVGQLGWVLTLFVGGVESGESPGAACAETFSPGFQMARTLGLLATFVGALGAALVAGRGPLDRLRAWLSGDVDVVFGLNRGSLELVQVLLVENRDRPKRERWIDARPGWRRPRRRAKTMKGTVDEPATRAPVEEGVPDPGFLQSVRETVTGGRPYDRPRWWLRRAHVIVMDTNPGNPLVGAARDLGAIVLTDDVVSTARMRGLLTRWSPSIRRRWTRRVSLRRMYVVSESRQSNLRVVDTVREALHPRYEQHRSGMVPRVLVLFEDAWQGWAFRNANLTQQQWLLDASGSKRDAGTAPAFIQVPTGRSWQPIIDGITSLDLVCQQIVEEFLPPDTLIPEQQRTVVIVGDSPAWFTLVNEIQWQLFTRYEVSDSRQRERLRGAFSVHLVGRFARDRAREWNGRRAPWRLPDDAGSDGAAISRHGQSTTRCTSC